MESIEAEKYIIEYDGKTVWVNDGTGLIGRFSRFGIDIHHTFENQLKDGTECLYCTHVLPAYNDWVYFKNKMLQFHAVIIPDHAAPDFILGYYQSKRLNRWNAVLYLVIPLLVFAILWMAYSAHAATPWERAVSHRTGVTQENACLLLALDLTPCEEPRKKPKDKRHG